MNKKYIKASAIFNSEKIKGYIDFIELLGRNKVQIIVNLCGLNKNSYYGFHIHRINNILSECDIICTHFNPYIRNKRDSLKIVGDLINIVSDDNGSISCIIYSDIIQIHGESNNIIGRSLIIHEYIDIDENMISERIDISVIGYI
jgi:Cu/Zn superoxide dismutase